MRVKNSQFVVTKGHLVCGFLSDGLVISDLARPADNIDRFHHSRVEHLLVNKSGRHKLTNYN